DVVGMMLLEAFGAVTPLQQEGLARGHARERLLQLPCLAGKDERWPGGKPRLDLREGFGIGILRNLEDWLRPPAVGCPGSGHRLRLRIDARDSRATATAIGRIPPE